jgi:hypothetical protein
MDGFHLDITKILFIFLILTILGINVFYYLARTTDIVASVGEKSISKTVDTTKSIVQTSAEGTKFGADIASGTISSGLDVLEQSIGVKPNLQPQKPVVPDDSDSSIQILGRKGFCYIGTEGKTRTCMQVGVHDQCMSGNIYPTMAICMNPNLRV